MAETHENGVIDGMTPNLRPLDQSASTGGLKWERTLRSLKGRPPNAVHKQSEPPRKIGLCVIFSSVF